MDVLRGDLLFHSAHEGTHGRMAKVACVRHSTMPDSLLHNLKLAYFNMGAQKTLFQRTVPGGAELFQTNEIRSS